MKFWDASAVVPLLAVQSTTRLAQSIFSADAFMSVWWATPIECASALNRLEREGKIDSKGMAAANARLRGLGAIWNEVQASESLRESAERLVYAYNLRAGDAMQLAAALRALASARMSLGHRYSWHSRWRAVPVVDRCRSDLREIFSGHHRDLHITESDDLPYPDLARLA